MRDARTFGARVRGARTAQGYSRVEVAQRAHLSAISLANYELDVQFPRRDKLEALAAVLGVPAGWLAGG